MQSFKLTNELHIHNQGHQGLNGFSIDLICQICLFGQQTMYYSKIVQENEVGEC